MAEFAGLALAAALAFSGPAWAAWWDRMLTDLCRAEQAGYGWYDAGRGTCEGGY